MKVKLRGWVCAIGAVAGLSTLEMSAFSVTPKAHAQDDMNFALDEGGGDAQAPAPGQLTAAPADGPPSEAFANAQRLYSEQQYRQAAVQFQRVIDGETRDFPAKVQEAQFFLGKTLYHLRYYQAALAVFDEISLAGPFHSFYNETLQWLVQLATQLPDTAGITEKIGRYPLSQLDQFDQGAAQSGGEQVSAGAGAQRNAFDQLLYLMGRYKYDQQDFETALELFGRVRSSSPRYADALFYTGVTSVQLRRASPAINAFRSIIQGIDNGSIQSEDEERYRALAWISLGRLYYTAARHLDANGDPEIDGRILGQAVEAWNQVEPSSEYWLDAVFESSWAFFLATEYSRALGNIHSINSPYFPNAYYPEGVVIKAVTFFANCQIENATAMIQLFHTRYDPVKQQLQDTLARFTDNAAFFEFLKQVRDGHADMPEQIRPVVASALGDRTLLRHLQYVGLLQEEATRLAAEPDQFRNSPVGARIEQDISLAQSFGVDAAGNLARTRYTRLVDELDELTNQVARVQIEILTYQRGQLSEEAASAQQAARASTGGNVVVDEEHQRWPFDGEYWRDELGYYRQQVTNRCGR